MTPKGVSLRPGIETLLSLGILFLFGLGCLVVIKIHAVRRQLRVEMVTLELIPPPSPQNTLKATEEFFSVLGQVLNLRSWRDLIYGHKASLALEVVSSLQEGIRYLIRLPRHDLSIFMHNLAASFHTKLPVGNHRVCRNHW